MDRRLPSPAERLIRPVRKSRSGAYRMAMIGKCETVTITSGTSRATQMKVCECSNNHDVNRIMRLEIAGWASRSSVRGQPTNGSTCNYGQIQDKREREH